LLSSKPLGDFTRNTLYDTGHLILDRVVSSN